MRGSRLAVPDAAERDDLALFVGRAVRLDAAVAIRLRAGDGLVEAWGTTPFDVLALRVAPGTVDPPDVTVPGSDLLAALTIVGGPSVDAGAAVDERWRGPLPPVGPAAAWSVLGEMAGADAEALAAEGVAAADRDGGPSAGLLDRPVRTVVPGGGAGVDVGARVPMRCVLALAGMGFLEGDDEPVRVATAGAWLRLDTRAGAVAHRRWALGVTPV